MVFEKFSVLRFFLSFRRRLLTRWVSSLSPRGIVSFPVKMRTNFSNKLIWSQNRRSGRYNLNESLNKLITFLRILYMDSLLLWEAKLNVWHGLPSSDLPHESISYAKLKKKFMCSAPIILRLYIVISFGSQIQGERLNVMWEWQHMSEASKCWLPTETRWPWHSLKFRKSSISEKQKLSISFYFLKELCT